MFYQLRFQKDYQQILNDYLNDQDAKVNIGQPQYYDNFIKLNVKFYPLKGNFKGYKFSTQILITHKFPYKPVIVFSKRLIYHPNINQYNNQIYCKILDMKEWAPNFTLSSIIQRLKYVIYNPELGFIPENDLNIKCSELYQYDLQQFMKKFDYQYQQHYDTNYLEKDLDKKMILEDNQKNKKTKKQNKNKDLYYLKNKIDNIQNIDIELNSSYMSSSFQDNQCFPTKTNIDAIEIEQPVKEDNSFYIENEEKNSTEENQDSLQQNNQQNLNTYFDNNSKEIKIFQQNENIQLQLIATNCEINSKKRGFYSSNIGVNILNFQKQFKFL
ncbi:ubiquitin-conjugating enzyme family protein, putative [Ichthyophthirius multifiliis]|uniref:Ubiquitin-conjugating enzyme family protein, putative n=1 Tax=Ichthyophthirius multifiliis TaxID=5932 RepID=G0R268_ICHMU|nr:ubiquitin-conjugating enzyme family protein, putative [Ichthyophthirius multifiliis]EGR28435.1 ubiquitin-conjugating enzyme family protein, putative [Ichthyophthirius multifiliis]|eukprot:XP_004029671.1 ubiquitin-conjugating enzyme family protein, putative [Ichthyophthirius multifiliis]